jgi:hypothetical protein
LIVKEIDRPVILEEVRVDLGNSPRKFEITGKISSLRNCSKLRFARFHASGSSFIDEQADRRFSRAL